MTLGQDPYWDELGLAWTAQATDPGASTARLKARLRRQAVGLRLAVLGAALGGLLGLALGGWTLWIGWTGHVWHFLVRGVAVLMVSGLAGLAAIALAGGVRDDSRSLIQALDLSILRAERRRRAMGLGLWACGLCAVLGLAGYGLRAWQGHPAAMSPVEPLAFLALAALALALVRRAAAGELAMSRHLRRALDVGADGAS